MIGTSELNKVMRHKGCSNVGHILCREHFECRIGDVSRGDQEELIGHSLYGESIDKVGILGHDDSVVADGQVPELRVGCAIAPGQVEGMHCLVSKGTELICQTAGEMRVNEKLHIRHYQGL